MKASANKRFSFGFCRPPAVGGTGASDKVDSALEPCTREYFNRAKTFITNSIITFFDPTCSSVGSA